MDNHYCRKSSNRQYLEPSLTITKMYDQLKEYWQSQAVSKQTAAGTANCPSIWQDLEESPLFISNEGESSYSASVHIFKTNCILIRVKLAKLDRMQFKSAT